MRYTDELRQSVAKIWEAEMQHPFVRGISDGSLPTSKFRFYLQQDYVFLIEYSRVFGLALAKCRDLETMGRFADLLQATLNSEMSLHRSYAAKFGLSTEELARTEAVPVTQAYTRHLLYVAHSGSFAEILAALLPCAWGYYEIGSRLLKEGGAGLQSLYADWIRTYSSEEFGQFADWLRDLLDAEAHELPARWRQPLAEHFRTSSRYEYLFWEMSWREEGWAV
jgi:thiaminase/transcriptional activator TenA